MEKQNKESLPDYLQIDAKDLIAKYRTDLADAQYQNELLEIQLKQAVDKIKELEKHK